MRQFADLMTSSWGNLTVMNMTKLKKVLMGVAALAALALGGAAIAGATGGGNDSDAQLTGSAAGRAGAAAVKAVGGGTVQTIEASDESGSTYEVKVENAGKSYEVQLDKAFAVTKKSLDDDAAGAGDGETNDDK
jgi:hypothetical protein